MTTRGRGELSLPALPRPTRRPFPLICISPPISATGLAGLDAQVENAEQAGRRGAGWGGGMGRGELERGAGLTGNAIKALQLIGTLPASALATQLHERKHLYQHSGQSQRDNSVNSSHRGHRTLRARGACRINRQYPTQRNLAASVSTVSWKGLSPTRSIDGCIKTSMQNYRFC